MDYLSAMRAFVRTVELGSLSRSAAESGAKVSTVSRYIAALEADVGAALFNRTTRRLHLTEAGMTFYERAARIIADVDEARLATSSLNSRPQGLLRINIPSAFGRRHVQPHLPDFLAAYPDIRIDATFTDATVDLIDAGADIAIRIGALTDSTLVAKRLAPHRRALCASQDYLARAGMPDSPESLATHNCLAFALQPSNRWYFCEKGTAKTAEVVIGGRLRANDSEALLGAALAGLGIALLPTWLVGPEIRSGHLVSLLPEWEGNISVGPERSIWGVYPPKKVVSPKVRAFLSFIEQRFGHPPYWDLETGLRVSPASTAGS